VIDNAFNLVGRLDAHYRGRKTIDELLDSTNDSLPVIMIDHRPSEILEVSKTNTDVQFSGHTHNGQMFPINLIIRRLYELGWGYKRLKTLISLSAAEFGCGVRRFVRQANLRSWW